MRFLLHFMFRQAVVIADRNGLSAWMHFAFNSLGPDELYTTVLQDDFSALQAMLQHWILLYSSLVRLCVLSASRSTRPDEVEGQ